MIINIDELKHLNEPYKFSEVLDLKEDLLLYPGIKDTSLVTVEGSISSISDDTFKVSFSIDCTLTYLCARTLEDVFYSLNDSFSDFYTLNEEIDGILIEDNKLDTSLCVLDAILANIPMRLVIESSEFESDEDVSVNKPFSNLKDLL